MAHDLEKLAEGTGKPWIPESPYFSNAEPRMDAHWRRITDFFARTAKNTGHSIDFDQTVDLATGQGRNSEKLKEVANKLFLLDYQAGNIDICKERFAANSNFQFSTNNGYDLRPVPDQWATFVYCFDAMVHFDSDVVRAYLADLTRVLRPGCLAFFHHSNYLATDTWYNNPHSRNFMSAELFRHYAQKEGLEVIHQEKLDWGEEKELDCFSMIRRPD